MFKKTLAVALALLAFNVFFYNNGFPLIGTLGFLLLIVIVHAFLWISFYKSTFERKEKLALVSTGLSLLAVFFSVTRASKIDSFLLTSLSVVLSFTSFYLLSLSHSVFGAVSEVLSIPWKLGVGWLKSFLGIVPNTFGYITKVGGFFSKFLPKKKITNRFLGIFLRGLVITLPVVGLIVLLLGDADPIFAKFIDDMFSFKINFPEFIISMPTRVIQSLVVLGLIIPMALLKIEDKFISPLQSKVYAKYKGEMIMLVSALSLVLAVFLVIQFKYLFATVSETQLHQFGVQTYSEYVRKGFAEMTIVSIIVYLVSVTSLLVYRVNKNGKNWLRNLNLVLLFEVLVFIGSVFRRVVLYQAEHGLTRVRVYGMMFLLMLIGLTLILCLRQVKTSFKNWYLYEIGVVVGMVFITSLINVDNLVATAFQPTVNEEVDYTYIARLSTDGLEGWEQSWEHAKESINVIGDESMTKEDQSRKIYYAYSVIGSLKYNYRNLIAKYGTDEEKEAAGLEVEEKSEPSWYRMNFAQWQAYRRLTGKISYEEVQSVYDQVYSIYYSPIEVNRNIQYDRSSATPLLN